MFLVSVIAVLIAEALGHNLLFIFFKPLIIIALLIHYIVMTDSESRSNTVIAALFFSWLGDVLLMKPEYFVFGLASFLVAHIFYIVTYRQHQSEETENGLMGIQRIRLAFPIVLAGSGLVVVLYPVLNDLRIPVMVYALVITVMVLQSLFRFGRTPLNSFWLVFSGAVLFMLSDALIAVNKFLTPLDLAGFWIMLTYSVAQAIIVTGLLRHK